MVFNITVYYVLFTYYWILHIFFIYLELVSVGDNICFINIDFCKK